MDNNTRRGMGKEYERERRERYTKVNKVKLEAESIYKCTTAINRKKNEIMVSSSLSS